MTRIIHSSKNSQVKAKTGDSFSIFFHAASNKKKTAVFMKAAEKSNKDQRELVIHADLNLKLKGA